MNSFPRRLIERVFRDRLNESLKYKAPSMLKPDNTRYFSVPYAGFYSKIAQRKVKALSFRFCKSTVVQLVFQSCKISSLLGVKDKIPFAQKSHVVYKFECSCCHATYIGETTRHLTTRIKEHLVSDKNSHVFRHLVNNADCREVTGEHSFKIIDSDTNRYRLKLREAIHIHASESPSLNTQVAHESLTLLH